MRCIFCRSDSAASRGVEHIIPEALGNIEHVLPRGVVCDACNNYFARKIEGPLLDTPWLRNVRSRHWIGNKRRRVPPMKGLVPGARMGADVWLDGSQLYFGAATEKQEAVLYDAIVTGAARRVYIIADRMTDTHLMSRFLAKVAVEVLAQQLMPIEGWEEPLIDDPQLDPIRRFARIGDQPSSWPFSRRKIYDEEDVQREPKSAYQVLHEYMLLYTDSCELYLVLCLFGTEFAINFAGPETSGYERWLSEHGNRSPLYTSDALPLPPEQALL
jgi:hypothetical protein